MRTFKYVVILIGTCLLASGFCYAQSSKKSQSNSAGYEIKIEAEGIASHYLYLQAHIGHDSFVCDSAKVKGHKSVCFKSSKKQLPDGVYSICDRFGNVYFDIIIDNDSYFNISGGEWNSRYIASATASGSEANAQFIEFQKQYQADTSNPNPTPQLFYESIPESFLGHYIKAYYKLNPFIDNNEESTDSLRDAHLYQDIIEHYFDDYTFSDPRLLHTPVYLDVKTYFFEILPKNYDSIRLRMDAFLNRFQDKKSQDYYISLLMNLLDETFYDMISDQVMVHIFDDYVAKKNIEYISEDIYKYYERTVERKRRTLPGKTIPVLECADNKNVMHSSKDVEKPYIVLWFWDPDCDDCKVWTPKVHSFYLEYASLYNFEVYAVALTDDVELWNEFSEKYDLSWTNLCTAVNDSNYDFIDYFNLITTPVIYLLDKNHTIIARNFPLEDLHELFTINN